jgi:hypothetical protein
MLVFDTLDGLCTYQLLPAATARGAALPRFNQKVTSIPSVIPATESN